jgi:hypothetical protein
MITRTVAAALALALLGALGTSARADDRDGGPLVRVSGGAGVASDRTASLGGKADAITPWFEAGGQYWASPTGAPATGEAYGRVTLAKQRWGDASATLGAAYRATQDYTFVGGDVGGTVVQGKNGKKQLMFIRFNMGGFDTRSNDPTHHVTGALIQQRMGAEMMLNDTVGLGGSLDLGLALTSGAGFIGQADGWLNIYPFHSSVLPVASSMFVRPEFIADAITVSSKGEQDKPDASYQRVSVQGRGSIGIEF